MSTGSRGRGRLSSIDLLPPECDGIIAWASQALAERDQTQTDIYAEFVEKCEALMAEHHGELEFTIPSFSSFNRHAVRLARLTHRLDQTRAIVASIADKFDPAESDNLTVMAAETLKALVLTMLAEADEDKVAATDVMRLATALKQAAQAQGVSSDRRRKVEADFKEKVEQAVTKVARAKGMTTETAEAIKSQILGVENAE